jgi:arabinose-5-phosphate isomerase
MRTGEKTVILQRLATVQDAIMAMTTAKSGAALISDEKGELCGIFTDGDLRRHLSRSVDILQTRLDAVMTANPKSVKEDAFAIDLLRIFEQYRIDDLPVVNDANAIVGYVDIQDLPKMKVM